MCPPTVAVNSDRFDRASNAVYAGIYETTPPEETFFEKARREKQAMEEGQGLGGRSGHLAAATLTQEQLKSNFQGRFGHNNNDNDTTRGAGDASGGDEGGRGMSAEWGNGEGEDTLLPTLRSHSPHSSSKSAKSLRLRNAQSNSTAPGQSAQSNPTAPGQSDSLPAMPSMHTLGMSRTGLD